MSNEPPLTPSNDPDTSTGSDDEPVCVQTPLQFDVLTVACYAGRQPGESLPVKPSACRALTATELTAVLNEKYAAIASEDTVIEGSSNVSEQDVWETVDKLSARGLLEQCPELRQGKLVYRPTRTGINMIAGYVEWLTEYISPGESFLSGDSDTDPAATPRTPSSTACTDDGEETRGDARNKGEAMESGVSRPGFQRLQAGVTLTQTAAVLTIASYTGRASEDSGVTPTTRDIDPVLSTRPGWATQQQSVSDLLNQLLQPSPSDSSDQPEIPGFVARIDVTPAPTERCTDPDTDGVLDGEIEVVENDPCRLGSRGIDGRGACRSGYRLTRTGWQVAVARWRFLTTMLPVPNDY